MAEKTITRSIKAYRHIFGKAVRNEDNTFGVTDVKEFLLDEKLGARGMKRFIAENDLDGLSLVSVEEVTKKYAIPVSVFMEHAVLVD